MKYDYLENMKEDIKDYIKENYKGVEEIDHEELYEELWIADCVTGNDSGSYYCNTWKAEEALCHNWDLLEDALREFGEQIDLENHGAEYYDVTIRCYLLSQAIEEAIEELKKEGKKK